MRKNSGNPSLNRGTMKSPRRTISREASANRGSSLSMSGKNQFPLSKRARPIIKTTGTGLRARLTVPMITGLKLREWEVLASAKWA